MPWNRLKMSAWVIYSVLSLLEYWRRWKPDWAELHTIVMFLHVNFPKQCYGKTFCCLQYPRESKLRPSGNHENFCNLTLPPRTVIWIQAWASEVVRPSICCLTSRFPCATPFFGRAFILWILPKPSSCCFGRICSFRISACLCGFLYIRRPSVLC